MRVLIAEENVVIGEMGDGTKNVCVMFPLEKVADRAAGVVGSIILKCIFQKWSQSNVVSIMTGLWTGRSAV